MHKEKTLQRPPVVWRMKKREITEALSEFSKRLNEDKVLAVQLRKPRGVALSYDEIIDVMQRRGHLPAQHETVGNRRYARTYDGGNPASEALVRTNLHQFISETRRVVKDAIGRQETGLIVAMCRSYEDGMHIKEFFTAAGTPLGKDRAFSEAIKQFFKDEQLVLKIVTVALQEHKRGMSSSLMVLGQAYAN